MEDPHLTSKKLLFRAYKFTALIMLYFFVSAIFGAFVGKYIDSQLNTAPIGFAVSMVLSFIISLILMLFILKKKKIINTEGEDDV
jgi:F0F1-type ATP synthase assembly protein I